MRTHSLTDLAAEQLVAAQTAASGRSALTVVGGHDRVLRQTLIALAAGRRLDEPDTWILRWAGTPVTEVVCTSGRYDLALFEGYELGVQGRSVREAGATTEGVGALSALDLERIEVISGSGARR